MLLERLERHDTFVSTPEKMLSQTSSRSSSNGPKENTRPSKEKDVGATWWIFTISWSYVNRYSTRFDTRGVRVGPRVGPRDGTRDG